MKKITVIVMVVAMILSSAVAFAEWNPLETKEEARRRHSYENYQYYQEHGFPLSGSYPETLGDTAPAGTDMPGFRTRPRSGGSSRGLLQGFDE